VRQQRSSRQAGVDQAGHGARSGREHAIADTTGPPHDRPQAKARIRQRVVGLTDGVGDALVGDGTRYGTPVVMRARPSVQVIRSAGRASMRSVGFDNGKMVGRSCGPPCP
jgi:hypothetical protein